MLSAAWFALVIPLVASSSHGHLPFTHCSIICKRSASARRRDLSESTSKDARSCPTYRASCRYIRATPGTIAANGRWTRPPVLFANTMTPHKHSLYRRMRAGAESLALPPVARLSVITISAPSTWSLGADNRWASSIGTTPHRVLESGTWHAHSGGSRLCGVATRGGEAIGRETDGRCPRQARRRGWNCSQNHMGLNSIREISRRLCSSRSRVASNPSPPT